MRDRVLKFRLPMPPTVNTAFRNASAKEIARGQGGRKKSKVYNQWVKEAGWALRQQRVGRMSGKVDIAIQCQRKARSDIDNRIKAVLDLLVTMGAIDDDKNVEKVSAEWSDTIEGAVVTVRKAA